VKTIATFVLFSFMLIFVSSQGDLSVDVTVDVPMMVPELDCSTKGAFCKLKNTLLDFQNSVVQEMTVAKARREGERTWCAKTISEQSKTVAERQEKVDNLSEHLDWLKNEKSERENDRDHKTARIATNIDMLKNFKKKRCDSNLIFVKNLREHMDAIQIMKLLKDDIKSYFLSEAAKAREVVVETPNEKATENIKETIQETNTPDRSNSLVGGSNANSGASGLFIEKIMAYSHLFNEEHKAILVQLKQHVDNIMNTSANNVDLKTAEQDTANAEAERALAIKARTAEEIGAGHVDNKQGILQALEHPPHEKYAEWAVKTEEKVLSWIDQLIAHLKESKTKLTEYEIKAATDFAIWHRNMISENDRLTGLIAILEIEIIDFTKKIAVAEEQLTARKELLQQAQDLLEKVRNHCDDMRDFYARNANRRQGEYDTAVSANTIYDDVMAKFQGERVISRINEHQATEGTDFGANNNLAANVVPSETGHVAQLTTKQEGRNEVVFY
jgi:uncharacterized coiled-coil protein SlyX